MLPTTPTSPGQEEGWMRNVKQKNRHIRGTGIQYDKKAARILTKGEAVYSKYVYLSSA